MRRYLVPFAGLLGLLGVAPKAQAQADEAMPGPQVADGFVYVPGDSGEVGCIPAPSVDTLLLETTTDLLDAANMDPEFVVILTAGVLTCPSIYYLPVKNDVQGIGYAHDREHELFDKEPERRLQGITFLNDLPYWLESIEEFESAFLHEIGHRWLARVHAQVEDADVDLTGRAGDHWSYFLDSGASPLEGNAWRSGEDNVPIADTPNFPVRYSPLDLYLMGAYGAEEVAPFRLLEPSETDEQDCAGRPLGPASPPQTCSPLEVPGEWLPLTVEHVVAAEGPRVPSALEAPSSFSVAFFLLDPGTAGFDVDECQELSGWVPRLLDLFETATEGRLTLENAAPSGAPCDELELAQPPSSGCQTSPLRPLGRRGSLLLSALSLLTLLAARSRSRRRERGV